MCAQKVAFSQSCGDNMTLDFGFYVRRIIYELVFHDSVSKSSQITHGLGTETQRDSTKWGTHKNVAVWCAVPINCVEGPYSFINDTPRGAGLGLSS